MAEPVVSVVIAHFETPQLVRLCLRSIRRFTLEVPFEVIVIDNASRDGESLAYLRQVEWIRLIERRNGVSPRGKGHKEAVDLGFSLSQAPFVLALHTDSIPIREDWLDWHLTQIGSDPRRGAVGTYKLELKSRVELLLHRLERLAWRGRRKTPVHHADEPYIRSHCALYRRELLRHFDLRYDSPETAGRNIHFGLLNRGFEAKLLDIEETMKRVVHLNHATMVLRPDLGARPRTMRRGLRRITRFLDRPEIRRILEDASLDRGRLDSAGFTEYARRYVRAA